MKSIRRHLTIGLLLGFLGLWVAAGAGIYTSVRHGLIKSLDAELAIDARSVRFVPRASQGSNRNAGSRRLQDRLPEYLDPEGGHFFQTWTKSGETIEKSESLGEFEFAFPGASVSSDPGFATVSLPDGRAVRTMHFRVSSGAKGKSKARSGASATITLLGIETRPADEILARILAGIGIVGVVIAGCAVVLVGLVVHRGLSPLRELGEQTSSIDTHSLDARFRGEEAPVELQPIYDHLNRLIDRLETGFERERRFSSDLAHEMRTPVAELKMLNEVALRWEDQAGQKTHEASLAIAERIGETVETLLALARCESGEVAVRSEPIDLAEFCRECAEDFSERASEREVDLRFSFPENSPTLETDPGLLRHIVVNLLSNAVEYAPSESEIHCRGEEGGGLSVSNPAPDLDESDVGRLFDRHWRGDSARSDQGHAGLGLSLAASCAQACGLRLEASLEEGILSFTLAPDPAMDTVD